MNLPRFGVARPVLTTMITAMVVVLGLVSAWLLPVDLFPEIEVPSITLNTTYEGASPAVVERRVTEVIEAAVATVAGVQEIRSISAEGISAVTVVFAQGVSLDAATDDVRDRLDREIDELPIEASRPQLRKFDIARFPVVVLGISSDLDPIELTDLIEQRVRPRFERIAGVASVDIFGGFDREVRIEVDPARVQALGLPLGEIVAAVRDANVEAPAGQLVEGRYQVGLQAPGEFADLDAIRDTVIATRNGAPIAIRQVAEVHDTFRDLTRIVRVNGRPGVRLGIRKQADANTVDVASAVLREVEGVNRDLPQVDLVPVFNQGSFIERSLANVGQSVLLGGVLAVFVLYAFLRDARATTVIAVAIPIAVLATFALLAMQGLSLNLMTLGGLALGVGLMVDNSIVVVENVFRRQREEGESVEASAVAGASEVTGALLASTLTTLVIFLPLVFARGVTGVLFRELALVIAYSLLASLVVALGLVPMLASRWMRPIAAEPIAPGPIGRSLARVESGYARLLATALNRPRATFALALALLGVAALAGRYVGTEFQPPSDEGEVRVSGEMEQGTRLELVDRQTRRLEAAVAALVPEAVSTVVNIGPSGRRPDDGARGEVEVALGPAGQRSRSNTEIANALRQALDGQVPGMVVRVRAPQGQFLLQRLLGGEDGLTVDVLGYDLEVLDRLAAQVVAGLRDIDGITDVTQARSAGVPQRRLRVDRTRAAALGLSVRQVSDALQTAVAGTPAGDFRIAGNAYRILVRLADARYRDVDEVLDLTLPGPGGRPVALRNTIVVEDAVGPVVIDRKNQQRSMAIQANVDGRDLGSVASDVRAMLADIAVPVGFELRLGGSVEAQGDAFGELGLALGLSLVLVYMVLAGQYESYRDPLIVMFAVPCAGVGVVFALLLTGSTLNMQSGIGCVMLGGIVVNNAILIVDQASRLLAEGHAPTAAAREAGRRRFRPVLMTTLTTALGLFPLALGIGEGADAQAPLARAVLGGLVASTAMTLLVVPCIYTFAHGRVDRRGESA